MKDCKLSPILWLTKEHMAKAKTKNSQLTTPMWYELTIKRGQSRVTVSYPSPHTLIPYDLQKRVTWMYRVKWKHRRIIQNDYNYYPST